VVCHHSLLLMNSFNKTEAAVFSCRLCFLRAFPFISLRKPGLLFSRAGYAPLGLSLSSVWFKRRTVSLYQLHIYAYFYNVLKKHIVILTLTKIYPLPDPNFFFSTKRVLVDRCSSDFNGKVATRVSCWVVEHF